MGREDGRQQENAFGHAAKPESVGFEHVETMMECDVIWLEKRREKSRERSWLELGWGGH